MFLQEAPPETLNYMLAGFGVIVGGIAALIISFVRRARDLAMQEAMLEEIKAEAES